MNEWNTRLHARTRHSQHGRFFEDAVEQVFGFDVVKVDLADGADYSIT